MNKKIINIIKDWRNADMVLKRELIKEIVKTGSVDGLKLLSQIVNRDRDIEIRQSARKHTIACINIVIHQNRNLFWRVQHLML